MVKNMLKDKDIFSEEIHFFREVHPLMIDNSNFEWWSRRCFFVSDNALILEDLRSQGSSTRKDSRYAEARLGKPLEDVYATAFKETKYTNANGLSNKIIVVGFDTIALIAERFGLDSSLVPRMYDQVAPDCKRQRWELQYTMPRRSLEKQFNVR